jgi:RNA polymerase sigma factor (sigma-70 family)
MTRNPAEAEDLTQDVFVLVFRKLASFRGESAFTTWLHRLTVNQVLMHFRKNYVTKEQLTEVTSGARPAIFDFWGQACDFCDSHQLDGVSLSVSRENRTNRRPDPNSAPSS